MGHSVHTKQLHSSNNGYGLNLLVKALKVKRFTVFISFELITRSTKYADHLKGYLRKAIRFFKLLGLSYRAFPVLRKNSIT